MNIISVLKKALPVLAILALVVTVLNLGSYNPYNELAVLTPQNVNASTLSTLDGLTVPTLSTPTLSTPTISTPSVNTTVQSISVPTLSAPEIETPTLSAPEIQAPNLTAPTLAAPTLSVPEVTAPSLSVPTLETPTLEVPQLTVPNLSVPTLNVPELTVPTLNVPNLTVPSLSVPILTVPVLDTNTGSSIKTCKLVANTYTVTTGSSVTLSWTSQGYEQVTLNGENQTNIASGSKTFEHILANTTYTLIAKNASGSECKTSVTILCLPAVPTAPTCSELGYDLTAAKFNWNGSFYVKTASATGYDVAVAGNDIQANWTSNKMLMAVIAGTNSSYRTFPGGLSGTLTKCDIGTGCYNIKTLEFCANNEVTIPAPTCTLTPAASTINYGASVNLSWSTTNARSATLTTIGNVPLSGTRNTGALATSTVYTLAVLGTNGETVNCYSNLTVKPQIVAPLCPIQPQAGRVIVNFTDLKLRSDQSLAQAQTTPKNVSLAAGKYDVTLASWDGYFGRETVSQPNEKYLISFLAGSAIVKQSGIIGDLADNVVQASKVEKVSTNLVLPTGVTAVRADQAVYPDTTSPNSLYPICAAFDYIPEEPVAPVPSCDAFTATPSTITLGDSTALSWVTTNATRVTIAGGIGVVSATGTYAVAPLVTTEYFMTVFGTNNKQDTCTATVTVINPEATPVPTCSLFNATPTSIVRGNSATLNWVTTNGTTVAINNGVGTVSATGTYMVAPLATTEYLLTVFGTNNKQDTCTTTVTVTNPVTTPAPQCNYLTATPASLPVGGGNVTLSWATTNAATVSIAPVIESVATAGSSTVALSASTNFVLTATTGTTTATCNVNVPVAVASTPISCANNVNFSASPTSVVSGNSSTLTWSTNGITGVSFDNSIAATGLSGSVTVAPTSGTTYNLTATNGTDTIICPVSVAVTTSGGSSGGGGGGGGSSSPRCEFSVSDNSISSGEKVVLTWDTSRAADVWITNENTNSKLVSTEGLLSPEKSKLYDGKITVAPKEDTTYVLTAKRGSKTRTCTVAIDIKDNVVVTQIRDQQPLVSGIALTDVPYTGFEAGPILTILFYMLLLAWALYVAYLLVIRRDVLGGLALSTPKTNRPRYIPEEIRPDVFVAKVTVPAMPVSTITPTNLPTAPVFGYDNQVETEIREHSIDDETMTEIENYAHSKRILISSDAIRHFIATTSTAAERNAALDQVINAAKAQFPAEDGWIVINEQRMSELCLVCSINSVQSSVAPYVPATIPEGAGSLAEAIVIGNVVAAYEMIGHRPMFALADAAADLDAVYRIRRGETAVASELLMKETARLTDEKILTVINALTSALDGTYTDEASAVKMAIMKAIKVVA